MQTEPAEEIDILKTSLLEKEEISSTEADDDTERTIDDDCLAEVGFLFEGSSPSKEVRFVRDKIQVTVQAIDDEPGALQSGHYLWPAATLLAEYLVEHPLYPNEITSPTASSTPEKTKTKKQAVQSVVELGAGNALASLTALQLWQRQLECVVVTDRDPTVLERARSNYESTLYEIYNDTRSEDGLNCAINDLGSIPVVFETLEK